MVSEQNELLRALPRGAGQVVMGSDAKFDKVCSKAAEGAARFSPSHSWKGLSIPRNF